MRYLSGRLIIGLAIIVLAILMLIDRLGYPVEISRFWEYWPVIPLIIGLQWLVTSLSWKQRAETRGFFPWGQFITGLILVIIGVLYLGRNLELIAKDYISQFWSLLIPLLLILIGLSLLRGKAAGGKSRLAILGGVETGKAPWKLESGSYLAFMGGVDLDLTTAEIPEGETVLDLTAIMGGVDVTLPPNLSVTYEGTAILGGVSFLNHEDGGIIASRQADRLMENHPQKIHLQCRAIMGGIEIKEKQV